VGPRPYTTSKMRKQPGRAKGSGHVHDDPATLFSKLRQGDESRPPTRFESLEGDSGGVCALFISLLSLLSRNRPGTKSTTLASFVGLLPCPGRLWQPHSIRSLLRGSYAIKIMDLDRSIDIPDFISRTFQSIVIIAEYSGRRPVKAMKRGW
jgi:hypothetical protein